MAGSPNYYEVLGIAPGAGSEEIARASVALKRELSKRRSEGLTEEIQAEATNRLALVRQASAVLLDESARAEYDRSLDPAAQESQAARECEAAGDFAGAFFLWSKATQLAPDDPRVWLGKARTALLTDVDEQTDAIVAASRARTLAAGDPVLEAEAEALFAQASHELAAHSAGGVRVESSVPWRSPGAEPTSDSGLSVAPGQGESPDQARRQESPAASSPPAWPLPAPPGPPASTPTSGPPTPTADAAWPAGPSTPAPPVTSASAPSSMPTADAAWPAASSGPLPPAPSSPPAPTPTADAPWPGGPTAPVPPVTSASSPAPMPPADAAWPAASSAPLPPVTPAGSSAPLPSGQPASPSGTAEPVAPLPGMAPALGAAGKKRGRRPLVLVAAIVAAVVVVGAASIGVRALLRQDTAGGTAGPSIGAAETQATQSVTRSGSAQSDKPSGASASSSVEPAVAAYCAELAAFAEAWPESGEHSERREVEELIADYQRVADAAVPAVKGLWDEVMSRYREAAELTSGDKPLTEEQTERLDWLNGEIVRIAGEIDKKDLGICEAEAVVSD